MSRRSGVNVAATKDCSLNLSFHHLTLSQPPPPPSLPRPSVCPFISIRLASLAYTLPSPFTLIYVYQSLSLPRPDSVASFSSSWKVRLEEKN